MLRNTLFTVVVIGVAQLLAVTAYAQQSRADAAPLATKTLHRAESAYVIGDDDLLGINVWNEPDFKLTIPVRSDGNISLPLIGEVRAAGRTPSQLQHAITVKLEAFMKQPDVTVMVMQMNSRKFNILGRVSKPGSYSLTSTTTVLDAIAMAGGFQNFAKKKDIYVLRPKASGKEARIHFNYNKVIRGRDLGENIHLEPGDTVVVP